MKTRRFSISLPFIVLFFMALMTGCRKDFIAESGISSQSREITLEELKAKYGTLGKNDRSGEKLPLYVTPLWDDAYVVRTTEFPIILTTVDTPCACPGTRYGGNLAFYKDVSGSIKSDLLIWETDSLSQYTSEKAPLDSTSHFSGMIALVNQQDTIEKIAEVYNGRIVIAKTGKVAFMDFANSQEIVGVESRDPWPFWEWLKRQFGGNSCPSAAGGNSGDGWWLQFWGWLGGLFVTETWDDENGENISFPPGTFFFDGGDWNWSWPAGYTPPGDGGISSQQFSSQMSTCSAINEYIQSIGEIPQGYSQTDLDFCQLVYELGLNGDENRCLFEQYGTTYIVDLLNYWNASDKSVATAEKIKSYLGAKCASGYASLLTDLLKENFCLSQHPIDLMENIKNECGFSSYESQEWYNDFNNGLSECTKGVIIDDWFDLTTSEKNYLLNNSITYDNIVNFVKNKGCSQGVKNFALQMIQVQALLSQIPNQTLLSLEDMNYLYDNIDGIEEATLEPMNPPVTATRPICANILNFATITDEQNTFQYTGMHLTDGYYGFTIPGLGPQNPFHIRDMHMIVNANSTNNSCLPSTASMAADAINLAVSQTQQLFNNLPPNPPSNATLSSLKATFLVSMDRAFRNMVTSCNSVYTSSIYVYAPGQSNPGDGLPINNIDVKIPACN